LPSPSHPDFASDEGLRRVATEMHIVPLAMSLIHLTGDDSVLDELLPYVHGPWDYSEKLPAELKQELRDRLLVALKAHLRDGRSLCPISPELMLRMMSGAVGEEVSAEYEPMIRAQMGLESGQDAAPAPVAPKPARSDFRVVIVGAGVSGILAGIKLGEAGIAFQILEKDQDVGGTWWENRYPGCAVDTPNHFYQFTFEPNDDWPNYYSRRADIHRYFAHCADKYGVRARVRFGCEVLSATFDAQAGEWEIRHRGPAGRVETQRANALITAVGQLNRPMIPDLPGLEGFRGTLVHTAQWPKGLEIAGKKVALVGSGASAIQVGPAIAPQVDQLSVFQRSGAWIVRSPNIHRAVSEELKWALKHVPCFSSWYRFQLFWGFADGLFPALRIDPAWDGDPRSINAKSDKIRQAITRYMERELHGRDDLLAKVVPDYPPYGKRVLQDPGWFKMLRQGNVELVTDGIARIEADGIRTTDGRLHPADVIVMATGFHAGRMLWPMEITGAGGKTVREVWGDNDPRAYLGMTAPDFPNLFVLYGPNTGLSHGGSYTFLAECQMRYVMGCIEPMADNGVRALRVRREVFEQYNQRIDEELKHLVWSHPRVRTWYKNASGRIIINSPWRLLDYWRLTLRPDLRDYDLEHSTKET
jgi:4-hydroxyacetophenone monooxygenase